MSTEAAVLTGGASRRMGEDKAGVLVDGIPMGERIVTALVEAGIGVTVLGRQPIQGASFLLDSEEFAGPLAALSAFTPEADLVFVTSCDLPLFDIRLVRFLEGALRPEDDAAVPFLEGFRQPLCSLYRRAAFLALPEALAEGKKSLMAWLDRLSVGEVGESAFRREGLDPQAAIGANTLAELAAALERQKRT